VFIVEESFDIWPDSEEWAEQERKGEAREEPSEGNVVKADKSLL